MSKAPHITYGYCPSPVGEVFVALSGGKLCYIGLCPGGKRGQALKKLKDYLPGATYAQDDGAVKAIGAHVLKAWQNGASSLKDLEYVLHGTDFQKAVWIELLKIKLGTTVSYADIARRIGRPKAVRAVGSAVGANPLSLLVPCHRVLRTGGGLGGYGWGLPAKKKILEFEQKRAA